MATQSRNLYDVDAMEQLRKQYEGTSFAEHIGKAMDAVAEETKETMDAITTSVVETARSVGRDVVMLLLGFALAMVTIIVAKFI